MKNDLGAAIRQHYYRFFAGHECRERVWPSGPAAEVLPRLRVIEFAPGPECELWTYASIGACEARDDPRLEFVLAAPKQDVQHVELVTMAAWYHATYQLGLAHTLPIGKPWLPRSKCEYLLLSLPYPFGPALEIYDGPGLPLRVLWLLPITADEHAFLLREGLDAL